MYMKIAVQYWGEIRYFDVFTQTINEYRLDASRNDYSVDFHITSWDNDYTRSLDFSVFDSFHLIESPQDGIASLLPKKGNKENREGKSRGFFNPSYSMFRGAYNRFVYQKEHNIEYDWILLIRPDFYISSRNFFLAIKEIRERKKQNLLSDFEIIYKLCKKTLDSKWSSFKGTDEFWFGTQEAIDLFCKNFHLCFLNDDGSFLSTYHNLSKHAIDRYHLFHNTNDNYLRSGMRKIKPIADYVKKDGRLTPIIKGNKKRK